MHYAITVR